ncbi:MAG: hypothetical protein CV088_21475 [Nitrospira sp. LK70]|nr:hypothetical protein [Nitrospira sp. LK70]
MSKKSGAVQKQQPLPDYEIKARLRKAFGNKICLHPQRSVLCCSEQIVQAHSVSASANLDAIAEDGHVMHFYFSSKATMAQMGRVTVQEIGVNKASTFSGFCSFHDSQTFAPIDQPIDRLNNSHCFLLAYRALCLGLYTKTASFDVNTGLAKDIDRGKDEQSQFVIQRELCFREGGLVAALRDLHRLKAQFDEYLLNKDFDAISTYVIELDHTPQIMCSVGFGAEVDFNGNRLQSLGNPKAPLDICTCSIIATKYGGAVVFAWLAEQNGASSRLIDSLHSLKTHLVPSAVIRLVFEHGENVYFSKSWWKGLELYTRNKLEDRANSFYGKDASALMDDGIRPALWSIRSRLRYSPQSQA